MGQPSPATTPGRSSTKATAWAAPGCASIPISTAPPTPSACSCPASAARGLGREFTRLVLAWAFGVLGVHRVELEVLASNSRAIGCYRACGFRREGIRRQAGLYPDGWKDFIMMAVLRREHASRGAIQPSR